MKYESGTHRVQRVPATETQGRVHTSAITVAVLPEAHPVTIRSGLLPTSTEAPANSGAQESIAELERCANALSELRRSHRSTTLSEVAKGALTADQAIVRVDTVRNLEALTNHAWRSAAHLMGLGT